MPMRTAQYLPRETLRRSRDLEFRQQTERDLDTFDFAARVETDIAGLKLPALGTVGEGVGVDAESNERQSGRPGWMSGPDRQDAVPAPVQMAAPAGPRPETRPTEIVDETPGATMTPLRGPGDADGQQQPGYQMAGAPAYTRPAGYAGPSSGAPYTPAAGPSVAAGPAGDIDNSSRQSFVRTAWPYALEAAHGDSNLAELILAKAISENGSIGTGRPIWANNFCYDAETEVLTLDGWVQWPDADLRHSFATLNPESGAIEYQRASHLTRNWYTGAMFRVETGGVDLLVTPEHRMWVRPESGAPYQIIRARDLSTRAVEYLTLREVPGLRGRTGVRRQPVAPLRDHVREVRGLRTFKEMVVAHAGRVVAVVTDFLLGRQRHAVGNLEREAVSEQAPRGVPLWRTESAVPIAVGVGGPYPTRSEFGVDDRPVLVNLRPETAGRVAPAGARAETVIALLDEVRVGQELSSAPFAGARNATMITGHRLAPSGGVLPRTPRPRCGAFRRKNYTASGDWVPFAGMVYCATVPNGLLVVRRNGKVVVSGNSGIKGEGDAGSVEADTWESVNGQRVNIKDRFAAYSSPRAGFAAFWQFLENNNRYHPALARYQQTRDADQLMRDINAAGYATDPNWAESVRSIRDTQVAPLVRGQQPAPEMRKAGADVPPAQKSAGDQKRARLGVPQSVPPTLENQAPDSNYPPAPWANEPAATADELQYRQPTDQPLDEAPQDAASAGSQTFDAPGYDPAAYEPGYTAPEPADLSVQSGVQYGAEAGEAPYGPPAPPQVDSTYTRAQATPDLDPWAPVGPQPRPPMTRDVREGRAAADAAAIARPRSINASAQARIDAVISETRMLMEGAASPEEAEQIRQSALRLIDAIDRQATDDQSQARRDEQLRQDEIAASTPAQTPRGYWEPTDRERDAFAAAGDQMADPRPVGPESWSPTVRRELGRGLGALQGISAASEYVTGRADYLHVPLLIRRGILEEHLSPQQMERYKDLSTPSRMLDERGLPRPLTDAEFDELNEFHRYADRKYQEIKDDPDQVNRYYNQAPGSTVLPLATGLAALPFAGGLASRGAAGAAARLGAGARTARAVGYGADVAVQAAGDPTNLITQPAFDAAIQGVRGAARAGRALPDAAQAASRAASDALPAPRLPAGAQALPGAGPPSHIPVGDSAPRRGMTPSRLAATGGDYGWAARWTDDMAGDVERGTSSRGWGVQPEATEAAARDALRNVGHPDPDGAMISYDPRAGGYIEVDDGLSSYFGASPREAVDNAMRDADRFEGRQLYIYPARHVGDDEDAMVFGAGIARTLPIGQPIQFAPPTPRAGVATLDPRTAGLGSGRVPGQIEREALANARPPLTIAGEASGAAIGGLTGAAIAPEDATWEERTSRALLGAGLGLGAGGTLGRAATVGSARLLDSAIKAGRLTPDILERHPDPARRIMTILALAAEGLDDAAPVAVPAIADFVALHAPRESARLGRLLSGQATAGEIRQVANRTLGRGLGQQVAELMDDILTGKNRRAFRAGENRADLAAVRGLPEGQRGLADPRTETYGREVWTHDGTGVETNDPRVVTLVNEITSSMGVRGPVKVYVIEAPQPNAFAMVGTNARPAIAITRGALDQGVLSSEIRGLLQHETGHIGEDVAAAAGGRGQRASAMPVVPPDAARQTNVPVNVPDDTHLIRAVERAGGTVTPDGIEIDIRRHQKPAQAGQQANRRGVFYLSGDNPYQSQYGSFGPNDTSSPVGGPQRVEGRTLIRNPLVTQGGEVASAAWGPLGVPGTPQGLMDAVSAAVQSRDPVKALAQVLRQYGGDPSLAESIIRTAVHPSEIPLTVTDNIMGTRAAALGHDAIIALERPTFGQDPMILEVMDVREATYPTPGGGFSLRPEFQQGRAMPGVEPNSGAWTSARDQLDEASSRLRAAERAAEDAATYGTPQEAAAARREASAARQAYDQAADALEAVRRADAARSGQMEAAGFGRPMDEADTLRSELDAPGGATGAGEIPRTRDDTPRVSSLNAALPFDPTGAAAGGALGAASEDEDGAGDPMRAGAGLVIGAIGGAKRGPKIAVDPKRVAAEVARGPHIGARLNRELKPPASSVPISVRVAGKLADAKAPQAWAEDVLRGMAGEKPLPASSADRPSVLARVNPGSVADERIRAELEAPITRAAEAGLQDELPGYLDDLAQQDALDSAYQAGREAFEAAHAGKMPPARLDRGADRAGQAAMRRAQQGGPGGTYEDIVARVEATRERATTAGTVDALDEAAEAVWEHNRQTLARLRDAGDISQAEHDAILAAHPHLVPTVPIMGLDPSGAGPTGRVLNRFGGQGKGERLNPIVASRNLTVEAERAAAKNQVFTAFSRLIDDAVNAGGLTLDGSRRLWDGNVPVSGMIDGKPTTYYLPRPVADALESAGAQGVDSNAWSAILKRVGGFVTSTITAARASFLPVNLARDVQDYATRTAAKEGGPHKIPAVLLTWADEAGKAARDIASANANVRGGIGAASGAAAGAVQGDEDTTLGERVRNAASGAVAGTFLVGANKSKATGAARELAARGGGMGRLDSGWRAGQRWYRDVLRDGGLPVRTPGDAARWLGDWAADIATLQGVKGINERTELISRTAAMRRADQRGAGVTEAMIAGRDATVDFDRGGTVIRAANGIIPFLNATVQGGAQTVRLFRDHPKEATAVMLATLGPSLIAAEAWNRSDPERARVYDDVPQYVKDSGLVVVMPWAGSDARGERPNYLWIPTGMATPFMIAGRDALLANAPGLEPTAGRVGIDPDANALVRWGSILTEVASVFSPVKGDSPAALASSVVPPVGKQLLELGLNRDMYRGAPVASDSADERASAFSQGVSGAANAAGRMLGSDALQNVRPSQVEYLTRQLPAYGDIVTGASDMIAPRPSRADEDRPIQNAPFLGGIAGRFVRDTGGANLDRARDARLTEGARSVLEDAGLPPSTIKPVPSTYKGAMLTRDEQLRWQEAANAALDDTLAAARDSMAWDDPTKREQAVSRAITRARDLAARDALSELTDAEIRDRIERAAARKAG